MYLRIHKIDRTSPGALRCFDAEERVFGEAAYTDHDLDVHGLRIRVLDVGEGSPLVVLPGLFGEAWTMAPLVRHLRDRRLLLVNLPGAGLSDGLDFGSISIRQLALDVIRAILDHFQIDRAELVAGGIGGAWAFWFAIEYPRRVWVITQLGCPALLAGMRIPWLLRLLSIPVLNRMLLRRAIPETVEDVRKLPGRLGHPAATAATMTDAEVECAYAFTRFPRARRSWLSFLERTLSLGGLRTRYALSPDELRHVKAPVQFIWGEHDPFGGPDLAGRTVVMVPSAILHATPGGHLPWLDEPEQCAAWIRQFHASVRAELVP